MTANNDDVRLDASQHARAITRWENEGGASKHDTTKSGAKRKAKPAARQLDCRDVQDATHAARETVPGRPQRQS